MALPRLLTGAVAQGLQYGANATQALGGDPSRARNISTAIRDPNVTYQGNAAQDLFTGSGGSFQPVQHPSNAVTINSGGGGGGGHVLGASTGPLDPNAATDAANRAATLFGLDQSLTGARDSLGRLDNQLNTGYGNLDRDYQHQLDVLNGSHTRATAAYDKQGTDQLNEYLAKRSNNDSNAANWLLGARNTLGANGAGGGSAARFKLPFEAQTQATNANSADQAVNKHNLAAIAGSRQAADDQFTNAQNDLNYQRDTGRNDLKSKIENTRVNLLNQIGGLEGQRNIANGGNFASAQAAANPYTSKISALLDQIDSLSATPAIKAQQVTAGQPDLSGYNWARPDAAPVAQQDPTLQASPSIIPQDDQRKRDQIAALFGLGG